MSDNENKDVNCDSDCSSCGDDKVAGDGGCGSGGGDVHKQADLKTLVFVLVLILAGAVAAHSLFGTDKDAVACGADGSACGSGQVDGCSFEAATVSGGCPVGGESFEDGSACSSKQIEACSLESNVSLSCPISEKLDANIDGLVKQCSIADGDDVKKGSCCPGDGAVKDAK